MEEEKEKKKGDNKLMELALYFAIMPIALFLIGIMFFPELPRNPSLLQQVVFFLIITGIFVSPILAIILVIVAFINKCKIKEKTEDIGAKKNLSKEKIMLAIILLLAIWMVILFWFFLIR